MDGQIDRQKVRQIDRLIDRWTDRQIDRQRGCLHSVYYVNVSPYRFFQFSTIGRRRNREISRTRPQHTHTQFKHTRRTGTCTLQYSYMHSAVQYCPVHTHSQFKHTRRTGICTLQYSIVQHTQTLISQAYTPDRYMHFTVQQCTVHTHTHNSSIHAVQVHTLYSRYRIPQLSIVQYRDMYSLKKQAVPHTIIIRAYTTLQYSIVQPSITQYNVLQYSTDTFIISRTRTHADHNLSIHIKQLQLQPLYITV